MFVLSGCSESSEADYDKETLISQADALISSFSQMSSEELDAFKDVNELQLNLTLLQSGFNVDAANFTTMIDAWEAGVEECGDYVEHDDFESRREFRQHHADIRCKIQGQRRRDYN